MGYYWNLLDRHRRRRSAVPTPRWIGCRQNPQKDAQDRLFYRHGSDHGLEDLEPLDATQFGFAGALRMRHHPQNVAARTADSSDVIQRSVGVGFRRNLTRRGAITEHNLLVALQLRESCLVAEIVAFHMPDGNGQDFALMARPGKRSLRVFHPYLNRFADVFQSYIPHQRSRQQARFAQDLEPVADTENQSASIGELSHRLHHGRELGDGPRAQIVAVGEPARHDDSVAMLEIVGFVPEEGDRLPRDLLNRPIRIMVTVVSWENDDAEFHRRSNLAQAVAPRPI